MTGRHGRLSRLWPSTLLLLSLSSWVNSATGQTLAGSGTSPAEAAASDTSGQPPSEDTEGGYYAGSSRVGYIDNAIPLDLFRFRFDAGYHFTRPNRAEFFYAQSQPGGPGLPKPEVQVDYQEFNFYVEKKVGDRASA